jgi:acyl-CoA thioesterase I
MLKEEIPLPSATLRARSYRIETRRFQTAAAGMSFLRSAALVLALLVTGAVAHSQSAPIRVVALGDSLTAGLGVAETDAFPAQLERALRAKGHAVDIVNAGVSGDTASAGLARLDWSVPDGTNAVIVELGANDALRGIDPSVTRQALDEILRRLKERKIPVLLCGMRAPPNLGPEYAAEFDRIFPELAGKHGMVFYPFFLDGVAAERALNQSDGMHPTTDGVAVIVRRILPKVEELLALARKKDN